MANSQPRHAVSRRTALAGLGAAGLGLAAHGHSASAQDATPSAMAKHPIVGAWNVMTPSGPSLGVFFADGINIQGIPSTTAGPNGVEFVSAQVGTWDPISERGIHFTGVQLHSDANGNFIGTVTIDGYPVVSEDGQSLLDDQSQVVVTIRDASGAILQQIAGAGSPPVTGSRMAVNAPGFPVATPEAGTPTS